MRSTLHRCSTDFAPLTPHQLYTMRPWAPKEIACEEKGVLFNGHPRIDRLYDPRYANSFPPCRECPFKTDPYLHYPDYPSLGYPYQFQTQEEAERGEIVGRGGTLTITPGLTSPTKRPTSITPAMRTPTPPAGAPPSRPTPPSPTRTTPHRATSHRATPTPPRATHTPPRATPTAPRATHTPPRATPTPPRATPAPSRAAPALAPSLGIPRVLEMVALLFVPSVRLTQPLDFLRLAGVVLLIVLVNLLRGRLHAPAVSERLGGLRFGRLWFSATICVAVGFLLLFLSSLSA
jgi:hypothetical protein